MSDESVIFTIKWGDEINHLSQQMKSLLEDTVMIKSGVVGERTTMEQLASRSMTKVTSRHKPITPNDPDLRRRWITMFDYNDAAIFDTQDALKTILDPKAPFTQSLVMGANRLKDDVIIAAAVATAYTGKDGTGTQAITNTIANGGKGTTLDKLRQAQRTFLEGNVDPDESRVYVCGPKDHEDLLKLTEVTSKDFNDRPTLVDGRVKRFMGFEIVVTNRLSTAAGVTKCLAYTKSGMGLAIALEPKLNVGQRLDLVGNPWQAECVMSVGASRLEEAKVIEVDTYHA